VIAKCGERGSWHAVDLANMGPAVERQKKRVTV
jgi:hypothetical protein